MASRVVMPKLTDTMEEGVVLKWKKHEGDQVGTGDVLAEIETDKAVMDLEAFSSGTLKKVLANEGETVKAGALIAVIAEPDEDIASILAEAAPSIQAVPPSSVQPTGMPSAQAAVSGEEELRQKVSPRARAMAAERGLDLSVIKGSGPGGRIVEQDIIAASAATEPRAGTDLPLSQMRKAIARATTQSKAPVPHFYLTTEIAMDAAEKLRASFKESRREHPSMTAMLVKAAALTLVRHPEINVSYAGDRLRQHATIDIGVAVGLEDGLISPVLRDCATRTLENISTDLRELIERARNRQLQPQDYTGATFSISNLGMFDVENFIAVLMPPEAAALAVGAIRTQPVAEAGKIVPGRRMKVTLSCDHRALDGVQAAKFLKEFKRVMEHPQELLPPQGSS